MTGSLGGTLEAFYYAFGADDVYLIVDVPDNVTAAALARGNLQWPLDRAGQNV